MKKGIDKEGPNSEVEAMKYISINATIAIGFGTICPEENLGEDRRGSALVTSNPESTVTIILSLTPS